MSFVPLLENKFSHYQVLTLNITQIAYMDAIVTVMKLAKNNTSGYVCFANSHMAVEANSDVEFSKMVNNATLVLADGVPIKAASKLLYGKRQDRISGMDFLVDFIKKANQTDLKVFILGTTNEVIKSAINIISIKYNNVKVVGHISPPFNEDWNNDEYVNIINNSSPNVVFVSLGCPKQEKWMAQYYQHIDAVLLGIGGALPVFAGITKNAPLWMKNNGLEWLFRLSQEPQRLWKRYLITNILILWFLFKQLISKK